MNIFMIKKSLVITLDKVQPETNAFKIAETTREIVYLLERIAKKLSSYCYEGNLLTIKTVDAVDKLGSRFYDHIKCAFADYDSKMLKF